MQEVLTVRSLCEELVVPGLFTEQRVHYRARRHVVHFLAVVETARAVGICAITVCYHYCGVVCVLREFLMKRKVG